MLGFPFQPLAKFRKASSDLFSRGKRAESSSATPQRCRNPREGSLDGDGQPQAPAVSSQHGKCTPMDFSPAKALSHGCWRSEVGGSWVPAEKLRIWGRRLLLIPRRNELLKWWLLWDHCFIKSTFNINTTGPRCHNDALAGRKECAGF